MRVGTRSWNHQTGLFWMFWKPVAVLYLASFFPIRSAVKVQKNYAVITAKAINAHASDISLDTTSNSSVNS